ncbi:MAG TPA: GreA/GreB family elongation factor [Phycisphaerae bacterium]|nr:GreA/GreB family elongation factor [Phycisphaerae bacterium]
MGTNGNEIILTDRDHARLSELVETLRLQLDRTGASVESSRCLELLEKELERARIVSVGDLPTDTVAMNSRVVVRDLDSGEKLAYEITWPGEVAAEHQGISVLAPLGMALLGYRAGQVVEWPVPAGVRRLKIVTASHKAAVGSGS